MAYDAQGVGYLARVTTAVRDALDMGETTSKWTDSKLYPYIVKAWAEIMNDVNGLGDNAIHVGYSLTLTSGTLIYPLPANFGRFVRLYQTLDSTIGDAYEIGVPHSRLNPYSGNFLLEGNYLKLEGVPLGTEAVVLEYVPDGFCTIHTGTADFSNSGLTSSQIPLDYSPSEGYFDRRQNAYVGQVVRLLEGLSVPAPATYSYFPVQERIITSVDESTGYATLNKAWDVDPVAEGLGEVTYEVVPFMGLQFESMLTWRVAQKIHTIEDTQGVSKRGREFERFYQQEMRNLRMWLNNKNSRTGNRFRGDVPGSGRFGWSVGSGFWFG